MCASVCENVCYVTLAFVEGNTVVVRVNRPEGKKNWCVCVGHCVDFCLAILSRV